jgi:hypothetical protein
MILRAYSFVLTVMMNYSKKKAGWEFINTLFQSGNVVECYSMNDKSEPLRKYPLNMGRYLTPEEREDIRRLVLDTGPDWSGWKRKLESGEVSAAIKSVKQGDQNEIDQ